MERSFTDFVQSRCLTIGLRRSALASAFGHKNISKTLRRLDRALADGFDANNLTEEAGQYLTTLADALQIDVDEVIRAANVTFQAHRESERQAAEDEERRWRERFVPHGYVMTEDPVPSSITMFVLSGGSERWRKLRFDHTRPRCTYARQALALLQDFPRDKDGHIEVKFMGRAKDFIINYSPDRALRFDLEGRLVAILGKAYRPGTAYVEIGRKGQRMPPLAP